MTRRPWFSSGDGQWADLLDETLATRAATRLPLRLGLIVGKLAEGGSSPAAAPVQAWPSLLSAKEKNVKVSYLAPTAAASSGSEAPPTKRCQLQFQTAPYSFKSSADVAGLLGGGRKGGGGGGGDGGGDGGGGAAAAAAEDCNWRQQIDVVVVSLSDADVTAMDGPKWLPRVESLPSVGRLSPSTAGEIGGASGRTPPVPPRPDCVGATEHRRAEAHEHAKAMGGAVLRGDRFAAPSYFDVHSWRSMVAVRAGVPMVSYSEPSGRSSQPRGVSTGRPLDAPTSSGARSPLRVLPPRAPLGCGRFQVVVVTEQRKEELALRP